MNVRQAILKAADSIERNPELFNFKSVFFPNKDCGTPGCPLGWIGAHLALDNQLSEISVPPALGLPDFDNHGNRVFYDRMDECCDFGQWRNNASTCARTLRKYADKYHPEDKPFTRWWESVEKELEPAEHGASFVIYKTESGSDLLLLQAASLSHKGREGSSSSQPGNLVFRIRSMADQKRNRFGQKGVGVEL